MEGINENTSDDRKSPRATDSFLSSALLFCQRGQLRPICTGPFDYVPKTTAAKTLANMCSAKNLIDSVDLVSNFIFILRCDQNCWYAWACAHDLRVCVVASL